MPRGRLVPRDLKALKVCRESPGPKDRPDRRVPLGQRDRKALKVQRVIPVQQVRKALKDQQEHKVLRGRRA